MRSELIQAVTPLFLSSIGGLIGIVVLVTPGLSDAKWIAGFGLASTAIAGASGSSQTSKGDNISVQKDVRASSQQET